jgi:uncharacterized protein YecA (UPF0149 family)
MRTKDLRALLHQEPLVPFKRTTPKVGRNEPCPCGSGKKYKKCCFDTEKANYRVKNENGSSD